MSGIIGGAGSESGIVGQTEIDYEQGTWTPSIGNSQNHGSNTIGLNDLTATYTKIGNVVRCDLYCRRSDNGTFNSGNLYLRNLPFQGNAISNLIGSVWLDPGSGNGYKCFFYMPGSSTYALFSHGSTPSEGSRYVGPPDSFWSNGWYMNGALIYTVEGY